MSSRRAGAATRISSSPPERRRGSPMTVRVRLFARYREAVGRDRVEVEVPEGGTVETAWEAVTSRFPSLGPYRPFTLFALRDDYVPADHRLGDGDELCLFPPVSGGSATPDWIE